MEVELVISVGQINHIMARMIPQISIVVVRKHLNYDSVSVVPDDLEIAGCIIGMPLIVSVVASSSVDMTCNNEFAPFCACLDQLSLEPVKLLSSFISVHTLIIIYIHVLVAQRKHGDGVTDVDTVVAC